MSNSITLPASMQPPAPPSGALTTPDNPTESVVHYQLSSGQVASLPKSSVPALLQQDSNAKQIPSPTDGEVLVQLSSGHTATVPSTSLSALKQQDPSYKYVAGNAGESKQLTPGFDALTAVAGPTTALGTPLSPEAQQEGSGVMDILHGSFRQGASKIWNAEKPHVIQGSLLEEAMQKIDPTFQGSVTPETVAAHNAAYNAMERPPVDAAQFIDKQTHPVGKALAETVQSALTPANVAILYSTGGLGLVESPAAMGLASRLISGGFSAAAIANAYKNLKGFKEAYDNGDSAEAAYQLTHAITSGVLGVLAARGAVKDLSLPPNPFRKAALPETVAAEAAANSGLPAGGPATTAPAGTNIRPDLHQGVRDFVNQVHTDNGLAPVPSTTSVLDVAQQSADAFQTRSQATFDKVMKITGVDPTALKQVMAARADQIETAVASGDMEKAGNLQQLQLADENRVAAAFEKAKAVDPTADVAQARSDWNKSLRADELSAAVRGSKANTSTLANPELDPSKLTPRLQKLYESQPGGKTAKLAQLGGDTNAKSLVEQAETARGSEQAIKDFEPASATGAAAMKDILRPNTASRLVLPGAKINFIKAFSDFDQMTPEEQAERFPGNGEIEQARNFLKTQARIQWGKRAAMGLGVEEVLRQAGVTRLILQHLMQ